MRHIRRCQTELTKAVSTETGELSFTAQELNVAIDLVMTACRCDTDEPIVACSGVTLRGYMILRYVL